MWMAFEVVINLFQAVLILIFMKSRLHISKPRRIWDALCIAFITLFFSLYLFIDLPFPDTLVFVFPLLYAIAVADDKWYVSVFWVLVLAVLFLSTISLSLYAFMTVPTLSYDYLMTYNHAHFIFTLSTNLLLLLIVFTATKLKKEYSAPSWPVLLLFLLTNVSLLIVEESLFSLQLSLEKANASIEKLPLFIAYTFLCLCTIFSIFLFHMTSQAATRETRYKSEVSTMALSKQYQQELERMYRDLCAQKHDFQHHFQVLQEMVRQGTNQEAKAYLASYEKDLTSQELFITGCIAVDALLTTKYLTMKAHNIHLRFNSYPLENLPIAETDFCAIIGNLLDNAIEGIMRVTTPKMHAEIRLTFSRSWGMFYINQSTGGGFHASTHTRCFITMIIGMLVFVVLLLFPLGSVAIGCIGFCSCAILYCFPLVLHKNKRHLMSKSDTLIRRSRIAVAIQAVVLLGGLVVHIALARIVAFSLLLSATSRCAAVILQKSVSHR